MTSFDVLLWLLLRTYIGISSFIAGLHLSAEGISVWISNHCGDQVVVHRPWRLFKNTIGLWLVCFSPMPEVVRRVGDKHFVDWLIMIACLRTSDDTIGSKELPEP